jgi:transcriptional regulator GlxA family with amidase domain
VPKQCYDSAHLTENIVINTRRILIVCLPPVQELDIAGPAGVFAKANRALRERGIAYEIELVTTDPELKISGEAGLKLLADRHYTDVSGPIDTLLTVGGSGAETIRDPDLANWLRAIAPRVHRLGSICTGAFLLAEAGLLNGRSATTHWRFAESLARRYPQVKVDPNPIWVQDGKIYTSAGITAGMDLAFALVEEDYGGVTALAVARDLVLFLQRSGNQSQFSVALSTQAPETKKLKELQVWLAENLRKDLSIPLLAERVAMSPRNFARLFAREIGMTPARYIERLRVEAARHLLERTDRGLDDIAGRCGFANYQVMRRAFVRQIAVTPGDYRLHFRTTGSSGTSRG